MVAKSQNYANDVLKPDSIRKVILGMIEEVLKQQPSLRENLDYKKINELVESIMKTLAHKNDGRPLERRHILEPTFINQLSLCIMAALTLENKNHLEESIKHIFDMFNKKGLTPEKMLKMSPKEFKAFMQANFTKEELQLIHQKLEQSMNHLVKDFEARFNVRPEPGAAKNMADNLANNLFGLLTTAIAGSYAVPVPTFVGNGLGFDDFDPYHGDAPINWKNSLKDTAHGDSEGLNQAAMNNYLTVGSNIISIYMENLYNKGENLGVPRPNPVA